MEDLNGGEERVLQVRGAAEARTEMQKQGQRCRSTTCPQAAHRPPGLEGRATLGMRTPCKAYF